MLLTSASKFSPKGHTQCQETGQENITCVKPDTVALALPPFLLDSPESSYHQPFPTVPGKEEGSGFGSLAGDQIYGTVAIPH